MAELKCLATTLTHDSYVHEGSTSRLYSENACLHSSTNFCLPSCDPSIWKLKQNYNCAWRFVRVSYCVYGFNATTEAQDGRENRLLEGGREEVTGDWRNCVTRSFIMCTANQTLFGWSYEKGWNDWSCSTFVGGERSIQGFGEERDELKEQVIERIILKLIE